MLNLLLDLLLLIVALSVFLLLTPAFIYLVVYTLAPFCILILGIFDYFKKRVDHE